MSGLGSTILSHLWTLPFFLVYLFGLVFAVANWSRYPSAAGLAVLALLMMLGTMLVGTGFNIWLFDLRGGTSDMNVATLSQVVGFIRSVFEAIATALLIAAVFIGRGTQASPITAQFAEPRRV